MAKYSDLDLDNGALTSSMDVSNREFKELQVFLNNKVKSLDEKQKLQLELFALQVKLEDYLNSHDNVKEIISVGQFLRLYIDKLNIKQNKLARYIGQDPTNFNKILSGNRKVNFELSYKLGQIFNLDPKVWMFIQIKNEYLKLEKNKTKYAQKFSLEDLLDG